MCPHTFGHTVYMSGAPGSSRNKERSIQLSHRQPPLNNNCEFHKGGTLSVCAGLWLFVCICECPGWCSLSLKCRPTSPHKCITLRAKKRKEKLCFKTTKSYMRKQSRTEETFQLKIQQNTLLFDRTTTLPSNHLFVFRLLSSASKLQEKEFYMFCIM